MNKEYLKLAKKRFTSVFPPYQQPELFGYDFRNWVSPYTKMANKQGDIAIVLQDWASADKLAGGSKHEVQRHGRFPKLLTNKRLDLLLDRVFQTSISDVYVTNVFPFVKPGGMSASIPLSDLRITAREFTVPELKLAKPWLILALGRRAQQSLEGTEIDAISLPHPAARGMGLDTQVKIWRDTLDERCSDNLLSR